MSEKMDMTGAQKKLAETLKGIGMDLWGTADPDRWAELAFGQSAALKPSPGQEMEETKLQPAFTSATQEGTEQENAAPKPALTIENLWKNADETVEWTEALIRENPGDGLTEPERWWFYHRMAGPVLAGDLKAYVEVLTTLNPLGDLTGFVSGMLLRAPSAERLECEFECKPELMEKDARMYLGGLSLRIARDLLAVLPAEEIHIFGRMNGDIKADVTFRREQLLKQKMAFINPADFAEACGGMIAE